MKDGRLLELHSFQETLHQGMCGAASLLIVLDYYGIKKTESELAGMLGIDKRLGTDAAAIRRVAESCGLKVEIKDKSSLEEIDGYLEKRIPVIVDWFSRGRNDYDDSEVADGHYSVVAGLDEEYIYLQDPEIGKIRKIMCKDFMRVWFDFESELIGADNLIIRQIIAIF